MQDSYNALLNLVYIVYSWQFISLSSVDIRLQESSSEQGEGLPIVHIKTPQKLGSIKIFLSHIVFMFSFLDEYLGYGNC